MPFISCICSIYYECLLKELLPEIKLRVGQRLRLALRPSCKDEGEGSTGLGRSLLCHYCVSITVFVNLYVCWAWRANAFELVLLLSLSWHETVKKMTQIFELFGRHPPSSGIDTSHPQLPLTVCLCSQYVTLLHMTKPYLYVSQCPRTPNVLLRIPYCSVPMQLSPHPRCPVCSQPCLHCLIDK